MTYIHPERMVHFSEREAARRNHSAPLVVAVTTEAGTRELTGTDSETDALAIARTGHSARIYRFSSTERRY